MKSWKNQWKAWEIYACVSIEHEFSARDELLIASVFGKNEKNDK